MKPIPLDDRLPGLYDPENVRSWRLTKAAIFVLIAVGAVVWLAVDQRRASAQREIARSGATVQGRVTELDSQRGGQLLAISYEFTSQGAPYAIEKRPVGDFHGLTKGGPITISFDPSDPRRCVTAHDLTHARFGWSPFLFGGVIVIMMVIGPPIVRPWKSPTRRFSM